MSICNHGVNIEIKAPYQGNIDYPEGELDALKHQLEVLENWKAEAMAVEAQWDTQEVGRELGLTLGTDIRPQILPKIREIREQFRITLGELERKLAADELQLGIDKIKKDAISNLTGPQLLALLQYPSRKYALDAAIAEAVQFEKDVSKRWEQLSADNEKRADEMMLDRDSLARERDDLSAATKPLVNALIDISSYCVATGNNKVKQMVDEALSQVNQTKP